MARHMASFLADLALEPHAEYSYQPLPAAVVYPSLADEVFCGGFYLRNLTGSFGWRCP